jgi:hypothetical protein
MQQNLQFEISDKFESSLKRIPQKILVEYGRHLEFLQKIKKCMRLTWVDL